MITQYKNIDQIKNSTKSVAASRISKSRTEFFSYDAEKRIFPVPEIVNQLVDNKIELHVYSGDAWLTGNHSVTQQTKIPEYRDKQTNQLITFPSKPVAIDLYDEFNKLKLTAGNFKIVVNFFKNLIGSYEQQHLRIDEISPDRTEIRLRAIDDTNPEFLTQITKYIQTVRPTSSRFHKTYLLNFSRNQNAVVVNTVVIGDYVYVKLYEPLLDTFDVNFKCWIVEELKPSYIDNVSIAPITITSKTKNLANPNWSANSIYNVSAETGLQTWNDLLGSSVQTSQQIVDTYFSGSLSGIKLNIDYSDFNNFVFYSSATERLENFKYKLELLEYYTSQSIIVSQISGSVATTNATDYESNKTNLISGFDAFEKYLYYESSSKLTSNPIPNEYAIVAAVTGSYISPTPKVNTTIPYTLASTTSSIFTTWYNNVYASASLYDTLNYNALVYAIPEYIRFDASNEGMLSFVNMLGHHYDILYTYINHMSQINKREENPKLGMPNELLYSVAKQFGWNLSDGNQYQDLWKYVLGTGETGSPLTGSNYVSNTSMPGREMTYTVWRRIVNNLPLLLKSKGTKRSVQALLSCYGIPQSIISINEYGGPRIDRAPIYEKLNFDYALDLITSTSGSVSIDYTTPINAFELRFRLDNVVTNPLIPTTMNLVTVGGNTVTINFVSGNKGVLTINGNPTQPIEIFDGEWSSMLLRNNGLNCDLIVKRSKYGKIIAAVSASDISSFSTGSGNVLIGGSFGGSRFVGQLQELRLWSSSLQDAAFNNHVKAPAAYNGNVDAYSELLFRLPLTQKINHSVTGSMYGVQPISSSISASFTSWTLATPYDSIEETYYYDAPSIGAGTYDDNKVRIESNNLIGTLDVKTRAERSQFDTAPLDSKKLGVYFSPQTMIDEDIIAQLGFADLDQYIGDPGETDSNSYPRLIQMAQSYWKKYETSNNFNAYINMFTLFDLSFFKQLEQILPARADKLTGILIQPNLLERSKAKILPTVKRFDSSYSVTITETQPTASGDYLQYLGGIDGNILSISGIDDDQWQMYLTSSQAKKYDGTTYSYDYLIWSGSSYITASTPYWRSEAFCPAITSSVVSEFAQYKIIINSTASYQASETSDYVPTGIDNQRYAGTKMTSPGFNIVSTQTVDGGAVVEWRTANPNQLIYQNNGEQGSFVLV